MQVAGSALLLLLWPAAMLAAPPNTTHHASSDITAEVHSTDHNEGARAEHLNTNEIKAAEDLYIKGIGRTEDLNINEINAAEDLNIRGIGRTEDLNIDEINTNEDLNIKGIGKIEDLNINENGGTDNLNVAETDRADNLNATDIDKADSNATEIYDFFEQDYNETDVGSLKTELIFEKLKKAAFLHKVVYAVTYKIGSIVYGFWRFILDVVWKPLLKLYISPLRLIHSYLLPELISAECFDVYHGDIHRYQNPLRPYRPNKLELVKCIFQYLGHYFRSWQFVNRIEDNNYNLI